MLEELHFMERPSGTRRAVACENLRRRGQKIEFAVSGPDNLHVVLGGTSLIDVNWQQARAGVGTGWLRARGRGVAGRAVQLRALDLRHPCLALLELTAVLTMSAHVERRGFPRGRICPLRGDAVTPSC